MALRTETVRSERVCFDVKEGRTESSEGVAEEAMH